MTKSEEKKWEKEARDLAVNASNEKLLSNCLGAYYQTVEGWGQSATRAEIVFPILKQEILRRMGK